MATAPAWAGAVRVSPAVAAPLTILLAVVVTVVWVVFVLTRIRIFPASAATGTASVAKSGPVEVKMTTLIALANVTASVVPVSDCTQGARLVLPFASCRINEPGRYASGTVPTGPPLVVPGLLGVTGIVDISLILSKLRG